MIFLSSLPPLVPLYCHSSASPACCSLPKPHHKAVGFSLGTSGIKKKKKHRWMSRGFGPKNKTLVGGRDLSLKIKKTRKKTGGVIDFLTYSKSCIHRRTFGGGHRRYCRREWGLDGSDSIMPACTETSSLLIECEVFVSAADGLRGNYTAACCFTWVSRTQRGTCRFCPENYEGFFPTISFFFF